MSSIRIINAGEFSVHTLSETSPEPVLTAAQRISYHHMINNVRYTGRPIVDRTFPGQAALEFTDTKYQVRIEVVGKDETVTLTAVLEEARKLQKIAGMQFIEPRLGLPTGFTSAWQRLRYLIHWIKTGEV